MDRRNPKDMSLSMDPAKRRAPSLELSSPSHEGFGTDSVLYGHRLSYREEEKQVKVKSQDTDCGEYNPAVFHGATV